MWPKRNQNMAKMVSQLILLKVLMWEASFVSVLEEKIETKTKTFKC